VRLSFSSSSVGAGPSSRDSRLMASLPFEGFDDSSRKSDSITDHPRTRKIVEERPSFTSRKKVTFADDVGDSDEEQEGERMELRSGKGRGLMVLPSNARGPGVPSSIVERNTS